MKKITSRNNPETILAASLQSKKGRDETGLFIAEGEKLFRESAKAENIGKIDRVYLSLDSEERLLPLVKELLGKRFVTRTN